MSTLHQHYRLLLGLDASWDVADVQLELEQKRVRIALTQPTGVRVACPECGASCSIYDHAEQRTWRHLDTMQFETLLTARLPRANCAKCGPKVCAVPWADPHSRFTLLFEALAIEVLQACGCVSAAATLLDLDWKSLQTIINRAVERGLLARDLSGTTQLGMDEKAQGAGHDYVTVLTDISNHRVLEVTPGRDETAANSAWKCVASIREQITGVALDMWLAYTKAAATHAPRAEVVHDRFHLSKHLNEAVNQVRQQEHRTLQKAGDERLTGSRQMWLFNHENLSEYDAEYFNLLKELNLKTARAWGIKELFRQFWECAGEQQATIFFQKWYAWAVRCRLAPIIKVAKRFKKHWPRIVSYFRQRITNAMSEGFNSKIQQLKHTARGFKNFDNFRSRILFFCGKLRLNPQRITH
jgi:transposase